MASIAEGVEEDHLARSLPRVWRQPKSHLQAADELDWITKLSKVVVGKSSTAVTLRFNRRQYSQCLTVKQYSLNLIITLK